MGTAVHAIAVRRLCHALSPRAHDATPLPLMILHSDARTALSCARQSSHATIVTVPAVGSVSTGVGNPDARVDARWPIGVGSEVHGTAEH